MLDLPQLKAATAVREQVIIPNNCAQTFDGLLGLYPINLVTGIKTPDANSAVSGARHDVWSEGIDGHRADTVQVAHEYNLDVALVIPHLNRAVLCCRHKIL